MTDAEIIIAIAKLDGIHTDGWVSSTPPHSWFPLPKPYLTSRDAIIPVIEKQITNSEIQTKFNYALYGILPQEVADSNGFIFVMAIKATPKQLCIALLNVTGGLPVVNEESPK
jgi:hypothetical protein